ncbi:MAG TPA: hypothetical protein DEA08_00570, partial [Planctomycetes bacterium]|nr:hypothetical protein [Planctomycetota bacterium]
MIHVLIGGAVGAVVATGSTFLFLRLSGREVTGAALLSAAAAGLVGGAIASATLGAGGAAAAGAARNLAAPVLGGVGGSTSYRVTHNAMTGRAVTQGAPEAAVAGALGGAVGYGVGSAAGPALDAALRPVTRAASQAVQAASTGLLRRAGEQIGLGVQQGVSASGKGSVSGAAISATYKLVDNVDRGRPLLEDLPQASGDGAALGALRGGVGTVTDAVRVPLAPTVGRAAAPPPRSSASGPSTP